MTGVPGRLLSRGHWLGIKAVMTPELILSDSRGDGWLITIKPGNLESDLKKLLFGRKALSWYQREEKELIARTDMMLQHNHQIQALGPTMPR